MDQLFAPWRIEWVERKDPDKAFEDCVFCELPAVAEAGEETDRDWYLLARGAEAYVLLNNYPYSPGHAMVVPRTHTGEYRDLDPETLLAKERLVQRTIDAMATGIDPDGYNVGYNLGTGAGGSIGDHIHAHVVPRWQGDTNFMPTIAETGVIVEAVIDTYDRLHAAFREQEGVRATDEASAVVVEDT